MPSRSFHPSIRPSFSFSAGWETLSHAKRRDCVSVQGRPVLNQYHCTEITALYQPATWDRLRVSRRFAERAVWDGTRTWLEAHHQCPLIFNSPPFSPSLISLKNPWLLPALLQYRCPSAEHGANLPCLGFFFLSLISFSIFLNTKTCFCTPACEYLVVLEGKKENCRCIASVRAFLMQTLKSHIREE